MKKREKEREPPNTFSSFFYIWKVCFWHSVNQWVPLICILCYKKLPFFSIFPFSFCSWEINSCHFHLKSYGIWLHRHLEAPFYDLKLSLMAFLVGSTLRKKKSVDWQAPQVADVPDRKWFDMWGVPTQLTLVSNTGNLVLNIFPLPSFAVTGIFKQGFVRCHQFHFRIGLPKKAGNFGSIFCSYSLRQLICIMKGWIMSITPFCRSTWKPFSRQTYPDKSIKFKRPKGP